MRSSEREKSRGDGGAFPFRISRRLAFGDEPRYGDGDSARSQRDEDGKYGQGDLIESEPLRPDEARKDDAI